MRKIVICIVFLLSIVNVTFANNATTWFDNFTSLHSTFSQHVFQNGDVSQVSEGELWFAKPLFFRANYTSPSEMELVSDGITFFNYDVDLMQVTAKPATELTNEGLIEVLSGTKQLNERYDVEKVKHADLSPIVQPLIDARFSVFKLTSKSSDSNANHVFFVMNDEKLAAISAEEELGTTVFIFHHAETNLVTGKDLFTFTIPKGADVLGDVPVQEKESENYTERDRD